jgi:hypothetical protein
MCIERGVVEKKEKIFNVCAEWFLLGTLFDPCRLAYLAYTSND